MMYSVQTGGEWEGRVDCWFGTLGKLRQRLSVDTQFLKTRESLKDGEMGILRAMGLTGIGTH